MRIPAIALVSPDAPAACRAIRGAIVVSRYASVRYQGFDLYGQPIDRTVEGFHARVVQHECDHLWGFLYPMRMKDMSRFGFTDTLFPAIAKVEALPVAAE